MALAARGAYGTRVRSRCARRTRTERARAGGVLAAAAEPVPWRVMQSHFLDTKQASVEPNVVPEMQAAGYTLVDIRPTKDFDEYHAPGAVNVPLFRDIQGWDAGKLMRRLAYAANGMGGSEENPEFVDNVLAAVGSKDAKLLVVCESGGTYLAIGGSLEGRPSRSLKACYKLVVQGGFSDVTHVYDGMRGWAKQSLPMEGADLEKWKQRAGSLPGA